MAANILTKAIGLQILKNVSLHTTAKWREFKTDFQFLPYSIAQKRAVSRCLKSDHNPERLHYFLIKSSINNICKHVNVLSDFRQRQKKIFTHFLHAEA